MRNNTAKTARSAKQATNVPAKRASRGPKPGSARSNQTAVLSEPDRIKTVVGTRSGNGVFVEAESGAHIVIADWQNNAQTQKLAKVGQPLAALKMQVDSIPKPGAKLAKGVDTHNSPHAAKAVADNRRDERKAASTTGRKARGDAAAVAGKPAKAAKKAGGARGLAKAPQKLTGLVKAKDSGLAVGSGRMAKLEFALRCKTTADFLGKEVTDAAGKTHKCDAGALSGMVKRGHVRLG